MTVIIISIEHKIANQLQSLSFCFCRLWRVRSQRSAGAANDCAEGAARTHSRAASAAATDCKLLNVVRTNLNCFSLNLTHFIKVAIGLNS